MYKKTAKILVGLCLVLCAASCSLALDQGSFAKISFGGLSRSAVAPSGFTVEVSGPGMATIVQTYEIGSSATLSVPAGQQRTITVRAPQTGGGFILGKAASVTRDLQAGENTIDLQLLASKTKIAFFDNNQIFVLDDISGAGRQLIGDASYTGLDFDNDGNLYFCNYGRIEKASYSSGEWQIVELFDNPNAFDFAGLVVDRSNNVMYVTNNYDTIKNIRKVSLANITNPIVFDPTPVANIDSVGNFINNALTIDPNGNLYFAYNIDSQGKFIRRVSLNSLSDQTISIESGNNSPFYAFLDGETNRYIDITGLTWKLGSLLISGLVRDNYPPYGYYSKVLSFNSALVYQNQFYGDLQQAEITTKRLYGFATAAQSDLYLKTVIFTGQATEQGLIEIDSLSGEGYQDYFPTDPDNFNFYNT